MRFSAGAWVAAVLLHETGFFVESSPQDGPDPEEGAPIGEFEEYVLALYFQPTWSQGDCQSAVTQHLNGSVAAMELSIHGLWPGYDHAKHDGKSWPQFCKNATVDYTPCDPACSEAYCEIESAVATDMATIWAERNPAYRWGSLAAHEWSKHGSCTGLSQLDYFHLVDQKVAPLIKGAGGALVTKNLGKNITYEELSAGFSKDAGGKKVAVGCKDCALSDVWFNADAKTWAFIDYTGESTCAKCDHGIHLIDFAKEGCK